MGYIFWGYFCILFSLHFTIGSIQLDLPPDFLGYILIFAGLRQMSFQSYFFQRGKPFAVILAVLSFLQAPISIFELSVLIGTILLLLLDDKMIRGICEIEEKQQIALGGKTLRTVWNVKVIFSVCMVILWVAHSAIISVALITMVMIQIVFLVYIYKVKKGCEGQPWMNTKEEKE